MLFLLYSSFLLAKDTLANKIVIKLFFDFLKQIAYLFHNDFQTFRGGVLLISRVHR